MRYLRRLFFKGLAQPPATEAVGKAITLRYNIYEPVSKTITLIYNFVISKSVILKYNLTGNTTDRSAWDEPDKSDPSLGNE